MRVLFFSFFCSFKPLSGFVAHLMFTFVIVFSIIVYYNFNIDSCVSSVQVFS